MAQLRLGQTLRGASSPVAPVVMSLLGGGGQGEVYVVDLGGAAYAVKWYHERVLQVDRGLYSRLRVAIDRGAPSDKFIWPFEIVTLPDGSGLGYLMRLLDPRFRSINDLLNGTLNPSFRVLATVGCQLTDALFAIHSKGLAYQDLNAGNVFIEPHTGDIQICDNDNVDVDGAPSVMGGVWEFQAPEVVLRQAGPSRATDLHSLAVMLFRVLHFGHPLIGRRELQHANLGRESALRCLYGTDAKFVFDPADDSNRPLPERHGPVLAHWQIYPQFLRDLFTRAFTEGLYDPTHGRVQETEWRRAMSQLRDQVMTCPGCGAENFYDQKRLAARQATFSCWHCPSSLPAAPLRMGIRRRSARASDPPQHVVVLEPGTVLYSHHTEGGPYAFETPKAEVSGDPALLFNRSRVPFTVERDTEAITLAPGEGIPVTPGLRIRFDRTDAEIKR